MGGAVRQASSHQSRLRGERRLPLRTPPTAPWATSPDTGYIPQETAEGLLGSDLLVLESNPTT